MHDPIEEAHARHAEIREKLNDLPILQKPTKRGTMLQKANIIEKTKHHVECPHCHKPAGTIDHLIGRNIDTSWYCDNCGGRYRLVMGKGTVFTEPLDERIDPTLVFLRNGDVLLAVKGREFTAGGKATALEGHEEYFYNTHTCPTNFMGEVEAVIDMRTGNDDPHGIFEYVCTIPYVDLDTLDLDVQP